MLIEEPALTFEEELAKLTAEAHAEHRAVTKDRLLGPVRLGPWAVPLAACSLGAGAIHFAMAPGHWGESSLEGALFAIAGWLQVLGALVLTRRAHRLPIALTLATNALFVGAWGLSRTTGLPFGAEPGTRELVGFVDVTAVGLECVLVIGLALALWRAQRVSDGSPLSVSRTMRGVAGVAAVGAIAATLIAVGSPNARNHVHSAAGHDDTATSSAATVVTDGHTHDAASAASTMPTGAATGAAVAPALGATADSHDHATAAAPVDDRGFSLLSNGHAHDTGVVALDTTTRQALAAQLAKTARFVDLYPTVADAEAAGYRRAGAFSPGLGAHYTGGPGATNDGAPEDAWLMRPTLIYDGVEPTARLAGLMYSAFGTRDTPPEGFVGPNDHWHFHSNVCIVARPGGGIDAPLGADNDVTTEQCQAIGGILIPNTGYMVHVWTVPGYESGLGVFSELNPAITCPDGTYYRNTDAGAAANATVCRTA